MSILVSTIAKRLGGLPPDPELMNGERSKSAESALAAFAADVKTDREAALADLLTNLMHWCDRNATDFQCELICARQNYLAETGSSF